MNKEERKSYALKLWDEAEEVHELISKLKVKINKAFEKITEVIQYSQETCFSLDPDIQDYIKSRHCKDEVNDE